MSEASSYHRDYRNPPEAHYYVDPREHSSAPVRRNRYDSSRRVRDVSWISASQQPTQRDDSYARWFPEPQDIPIQPGQIHPMAHSSPMMRRTPSPGIQAMPSPMIGEFMTVDGPEEEEVLQDDDDDDDDDYGDNEAIDFEFPNAPEQHTGGRKGTRHWVGGFVQSLRKFPGLRKSSRRPPPAVDAAWSPGLQYVNDPQPPTISSLTLRPLTPSLIAQTAELMDMPRPQVYPPPPSPQHLHPHSHVHRPRPPAPSSPVYSPGIDAVPQVLSTVDERSSEQTGTQENHARPHSFDHAHTQPRPHSHSSHSHSHSQSQNRSSDSTAHPVIPNDINAQTSPSPWTTATVTDYITVPPPSPPRPPPTRLGRFLHNLDQLPWVESEQIVDAYYPGRSSRHRRHTNSHEDGGKPAASWYNRRHDTIPIGMGGPSTATRLYGWPSQVQKGYSQPEMRYPQFPYGYAPAQPVFVFPSAIPPPGTYEDMPRGAA
jgi:hypothetical protein